MNKPPLKQKATGKKRVKKKGCGCGKPLKKK